MEGSVSTAVTIAMPIADRQRSYAFYRSGLGFAVPGEPDEDGVPEPLRLALGDGVRVTPIPTGGFGWVISERQQAKAGQSECVVSLSLLDDRRRRRLAQTSRSGRGRDHPTTGQ